MTKVNRDVVINKHIHSCCATVSSRDKWVVVITTEDQLDFKPNQDSTIRSLKFPMLNGEIIAEIAEDELYLGLHVQPDKTFYDRARFSGNSFTAEYDETTEFKELVQSYVNKGYLIKEKIPVQKAYWDREREKERARLKALGVVLWMDYDEYHEHPEMYQGGFSDEVISSPRMKKYISEGAHGWIGNSYVRTAEHDKLIEAGLKLRGLNPDQMFNWLSSSSGRHFADSLCDHSPEDQAILIEEGLNSMFNNCIIFGCPLHTGNLESTKEIESWLRKYDILLPRTKYNSEEHINKLIELKKRFNEFEPTSEEDYIHELVGEIFSRKAANL